MTVHLVVMALLYGVVAPGSQSSGGRGTASIRGRITDAATGEPLAGAVVHLLHRSQVVTTQTDGGGRYYFPDLSAGEYRVVAAPRPSRPIHTTEPYVPRGGGRGNQIVLGDGEARTGVDVALRRALAISGRVVDPWGLPVANATIRLRNATTGQTVAVRAGGSSSDDRGAFRIFGLHSGRYTLCAEARERIYIDAGSAGSSRERLATTCYPSAASPEDSESLILADTDLQGVQIQMRHSRRLSVSGVVLTFSGAPAPQATVRLSRRSESGSWSTGARTGADGAFAAEGLVPGQYVIEAEIGAGPNQVPLEAAYVPLEIGETDIRDLTIATRPPSTITGRLVFDAAPPPRQGQSWFVHAAPPDQFMLFAGGAGRKPASVREDLTFSLDGVFVPARLSVSGLPARWVVREVRYKGRDVGSAYTDFASSREPVEIVVTNRAGHVSGRVTADDGEPLSNARVVMFPADPGARKFAGAESFSTITDQGAYQTAWKPPGEYLIVAGRLPDGRRWTDPGILEELAVHAERVTLLENDRRVIDLRVVVIEK